MVEIILENSMFAGGESMDLRIGIKDGLIDMIDRSRGKAEFGDLVVTSGFIDVHNHGAVGVDVNEADVDGLLKIGLFLASNGVTSWMPTLVPDRDENYRRVIDAIDELMIVQEGMPVAQAVGV
ncbi:MAG: hypothetical protein ABL959_15040, partial [Pyrinomonadaceae bacterium]